MGLGNGGVPVTGPGDVDGDGLTDFITNEMIGNGLAEGTEDVGNLIVISGHLLPSATPPVLLDGITPSQRIWPGSLPSSLKVGGFPSLDPCWIECSVAGLPRWPLNSDLSPENAPRWR